MDKEIFIKVAPIEKSNCIEATVVRDDKSIIIKFTTAETSPRDLIKWLNANHYSIRLSDYLLYCDAYIRAKYVNAHPSAEYFEHLLYAACEGPLDYFPASGDFPTTAELELAIGNTFEV